MKSLLIHTRASTDERRRNFMFAFHYHLATGFYQIFDEVIFAEFDGSPVITSDRFFNACLLPNMKFYFVKDVQPFSRSWTKNFLAKRASGDILMFADDDFLLNSEGVSQIERAIYSGENIVGGAPFDTSKVYDVEIGGSELSEWRSGTQTSFNASKIRTDMCVGAGSIVVKTETFVSVGGFNEDMKGWGLEDNALEWALWRRGRLVMADCPAMHLIHRQSPKSSWFLNHEIFKRSVDDKNWDDIEFSKWPFKGMVEENDGLLSRTVIT